MKTVKISGLDTQIYRETLANGFEIYLLPYKNKKNYEINLVTKYGSITTEFIPKGKKKMVKVPNGIAHFLEHKMFENKDFIDPFAFAAQNGVDCNAVTYFNYTKYLFTGNKKFYDVLEYLIKYLFSPYFTDENVEKEKGIIEEEILQYKDNHLFLMENLIQEAILSEDTFRNDIGGTVEDIRKITKKDLEIVYETFYKPSNMFLIITGNFDVSKTLKYLKKNVFLNQTIDNDKIICKEYNEPNEVNKKSIKRQANTHSKRVCYAVKVPLDDKKGIDKYRYATFISMYLSITFGLASDFREDLKKDSSILGFSYDFTFTSNHIILSFYSQTEEPSKFVKLLKNEFNNIHINSEDIDRMRKVWISSEVLMHDDIEMTIDNVLNDVIEFGDIIPNKIDFFKSITIEDVSSVVKEIDFNNASMIVLEPKIK